MGGIELRDGGLVVKREPKWLDELAIASSEILDGSDVAHVFVSGSAAILAGRSWSTEAIDVLTERMDERVADRLAPELEERGCWGPAVPLAARFEMRSNDDTFWVAPVWQVSPHLDVQFVDDEFDRASLEDAITASIEDATLPIGPLERQIALERSHRTRQDLEDAVHLYTLFGDRLRAVGSKPGARGPGSRLRTTGSNARDALDSRHERNQARRVEAIKRWVRRIEGTPRSSGGASRTPSSTRK